MFHSMRLEWDEKKWLGKTPRLIISPHSDGRALVIFEGTLQGDIIREVSWEDVPGIVREYVKYRPRRQAGTEFFLEMLAGAGYDGQEEDG